jgi:hypothetical protein
MKIYKCFFAADLNDYSGHTHVAEALKVPIHIFFTMPWTPTSEFPHPLSRVKQAAGYRVSLHLTYLFRKYFKLLLLDTFVIVAQ